MSIQTIQQNTANAGLTPEQQVADAAALAAGNTVPINGVVANQGEQVNLEGKPVVTPAAPIEGERPDNIPEKFWNAETKEVNLEALLKAQADSQAEVTRLQQGKPKVEPKVDAEGKPIVEPVVTETPTIDSARTEYAEKGELTDDTYAALEKDGITRDMVDQYIAGQTAQASTLENAAYEVAGSKESFVEMQTWAAANLSPEDKVTLNALLTSGDPAVIANGTMQLANIYKAEADVSPSVTIGGNAPSSNNESYKSSAEMQADMSNPKYKTDKAFRAKVSAKLANSNNAQLFG